MNKSLFLGVSLFVVFNTNGADNNAGMVRFFVKTMNGLSIEKFKSKACTVKDLLKDLSKNHGRSKGRLIFAGKQLKQGQTLGDCGVTTETNVHFVSRNSVPSYSATDAFSDSGSTSSLSCAFNDFSDDETSWQD